MGGHIITDFVSSCRRKAATKKKKTRAKEKVIFQHEVPSGEINIVSKGVEKRTEKFPTFEGRGNERMRKLKRGQRSEKNREASLARLGGRLL